MSVKIVIDSTTDVSRQLLERFTVVPMPILFGEQEYIDGITITRKEFYEKLIESDVMPSTSQATPDAFNRAIQPLVNAGHQVVVLTISSTLSGTYQSACIAAGEYPDQVFVVDTQTVTIGAGILAEMALTLADSGMSARDIAKKLTKERERIRIIALLDTLEYLKRGGRISKTVAFAGSMLSIKPVISVAGGEIKILGKARGSKQGMGVLMEQIQANGGVDFSLPVLLGYSGLSDLLLKKYIEDSTSLWEGHPEALRTECIGSVVGTHAGPGAIAAAFFANK